MKIRRHENRFSFEHQFAFDAAQSYQLLFMQLYGAGEKFAGIDLNWHMWFINTAPWAVDFYLVCMPINFDPTEIIGQGSEASALTAIQNQFDKDKIEHLAKAQLAPLGEDQHEYAAPHAANPTDDIRSDFDNILPFKVLAKLKTTIPILNGGFDAGGTQTFGRKNLRWNQRYDYGFKRVSVVAMFSRIPKTSVDLIGPWTAAGLSNLTEEEWRYLRRPGVRGSDNSADASAITCKIPWVIPRTDAYETDVAKVLNCVGKVHMYTDTNHPLAQSLL